MGLGAGFISKRFAQRMWLNNNDVDIDSRGAPFRDRIDKADGIGVRCHAVCDCPGGLCVCRADAIAQCCQ